MEGERHPVGGDVHVGLEVGVAEFDGVSEGAQGVLGMHPGAAAVGEGQWPGVIEEGMAAHRGHANAAGPGGLA